MKTHTFIDLFAGCGGLSLGLIKSGFSGVFAIEKNQDAFSTLIHNLKEACKGCQEQANCSGKLSTYEKGLLEIRNNLAHQKEVGMTGDAAIGFRKELIEFRTLFSKILECQEQKHVEAKEAFERCQE